MVLPWFHSDVRTGVRFIVSHCLIHTLAHFHYNKLTRVCLVLDGSRIPRDCQAQNKHILNLRHPQKHSDTPVTALPIVGASFGNIIPPILNLFTL